MAEIVGGLFGVTPESLQAQREAAVEAQALQYARLDPFQQAQMSIYSGANKLGGGIAGLMGAQDPEMMRIQQRQGMLQGLDLTNPESLKQGIQTAMQNKDYQLVSELTKRYEDTKAASLKARETEANIAAKLGEKNTEQMRNAASLADGVATRGTPEWTKAYNEELVKLTTKDVNPYVDNIGVAKGTEQPVYFDKRTNQQFTVQDGKRVPYNGGVDRTTAKTSLSVDTKGQTAFVEKLNELDAKRVSAAIDARDNALGMQASLNTLSNLNDSQLISGSFASGRVGAANLLSSLGLVNDQDKNTLANSESYQKISGDAVLRMLGGKLGSGFSNDDRKFIVGLVPQLENSPLARRQLINFMTQKNKQIVEDSTDLENYARANDGLKGYKAKTVFSAPATTNRYSDLSDAELDARIKAAQAAKK
jgi:hypothetical protein